MSGKFDNIAAFDPIPPRSHLQVVLLFGHAWRRQLHDTAKIQDGVRTRDAQVVSIGPHPRLVRPVRVAQSRTTVRTERKLQKCERDARDFTIHHERKK